MSVKDIASHMINLLKAGHHMEASQRFHADDVVSVEAMAGPGMDTATHGKAAVAKKSEDFMAAHEVKNTTIDGPFINGDQFALVMTSDLIQKASGQTMTMSEIALYTVRNDKVVEERFLYKM
jgi:hypothetical protein